MERHSMLAATAVAAALSIAMPANAGPLGAITGGASGGLMGTLGGTLSAPVSTIGIGAGGALGGATQFGGQIHRPDLTIEQPPLRRATRALDAAGDKAKSSASGAIDRVDSVQLPSLGSSVGANASAQGSASAGPASASTGASAGARVQASY